MTAAPQVPVEDGSRFRLPILVLALLSTTAGFADGYSLVRFDVFVANQSGNVVRIGVGLVGEYAAWGLALLSVLGFLVGAMLAWLLAWWCGDRSTLLVRLRVVSVIVLVLGWLVAVIGVVSTGEAGRLSAFLGAAAMGTMAAVLTHVAGTQTQPTFQSANVTHAAQGLLGWLTDRDDTRRTGRTLALVSVMTLLCYAVGGAAGAVAAQQGPGAILIAVVPLAAVLMLVRPRSA